MSEYVSVDPERLRSLANALKDAAATLRDETPKIVNGIDGWDATFSSAKLTALADWLDDQWGPMLDRADLAATFSYNPVMTSPGDDQAHWRRVPWEITDATLADEGARDAQIFASRAGSDDPAELARIQQQAADAMAAHADDPAYLQAFFAHGGATVIDTLNTRIVGGGVPLSEDDQARLGWYATGVAAATRYAASGDITLADGALDPLLGPDNTLTTGVMMKYGPSGESYGPAFLATVAEDALEWRKANDPPRPPYSAPQVVSTGFVPGGWVQNDDDWWVALGINVSYLTAGGTEAADGVALMREYDPVSAILTRTGQNPEASRTLLSGANGLANAQALVDYEWQSPGTVSRDDSAPAASVLTAATLDRGPAHGEQSALAAANVFRAGYDLSRQQRNDYEAGQYPELPPALARAMSVTASAYAPDLARSTQQPDVDVHAVVPDGSGAFVVQTNTAVMNGFMKVFMTDAQAAGSFRGAVQAQLAAAAQIASTHDDGPDQLTQFGYLNGMVSIVFATQEYDAAEKQDAANKQAQTYLDLTKDIIDAIPIGSEPIEFVRSVATAAAGASKETLFPTDAASKVDGATQYQMRVDVADMRTYVAQGFMNSGAYVPPEGASFVHDGVIAPRDDDEQAAFDLWWSRLPTRWTSIAENAPDGFGDATHRFAPDDDRFNEPK